MANNIKVAVRVRPLSNRENEKGGISIVDVNNDVLDLTNLKVDVNNPYGDSRERIKQFTFDYCYNSNCNVEYSDNGSQEQIFQDLGTDVIQSAVEGYNACLFAYGQTSTGKTYTMTGTEDEVGLIPRICEGLFSHVEACEDEQTTFKIEISYLEIYNERVRDLLKPGFTNEKYVLKVREHPKDGPYVQDLSSHTVKNCSEIFNLLDTGNENRTTAATHMHEHSSRSHAIVTVVFTQALFEDDLPREIISKVHLVDLAGSERADTTSTLNYKSRLKEGANINKSLVTLGNVIKSLAERSLLCWTQMGSTQSFSSFSGESGSPSTPRDPSSPRRPQTFFIPYRDSVLTWLLRDSLGGNSKTIMISTITPASQYYNETLSTLRYAQRAKNIVNKPTINEDTNVALIRTLQEEIKRLRHELANAQLHGSIGDLFYLSEGHNISHSSSESDLQAGLHVTMRDQGTVVERLQEKENMAKKLTQSWKDKWSNPFQEGGFGFHELRRASSHGIILDSQILVPHLVGLDQDILSSGVVIYRLDAGRLYIGTIDAESPQDIELSGNGIEKEHCFIENDNGDVIIYPNPGCLCKINSTEISQPSPLRQGDELILGTNTTFRFNNPAEAARLREHRNSLHDDNISTLAKDFLTVPVPMINRQSTQPFTMFNPSVELNNKYPKEVDRIEQASQELDKLRGELREREEKLQTQQEELTCKHQKTKHELEEEKKKLAEAVKEYQRKKSKVEELEKENTKLLAKDQKYLRRLEKEADQIQKSKDKGTSEITYIIPEDPSAITQRKRSVEGRLKDIAQQELVHKVSSIEKARSLALQEELLEEEEESIQVHQQRVRCQEQTIKVLDKSLHEEIKLRKKEVGKLEAQEDQIKAYIQENKDLIKVAMDKPNPIRSGISELNLHSKSTVNKKSISPLSHAKLARLRQSSPIRDVSSSEVSLESPTGSSESIRRKQKSPSPPKSITSSAENVTSRLYRQYEVKHRDFLRRSSGHTLRNQPVRSTPKNRVPLTTPAPRIIRRPPKPIINDPLKIKKFGGSDSSLARPGLVRSKSLMRQIASMSNLASVPEASLEAESEAESMHSEPNIPIAVAKVTRRNKRSFRDDERSHSMPMDGNFEHAWDQYAKEQGLKNHAHYSDSSESDITTSKNKKRHSSYQDVGIGGNDHEQYLSESTQTDLDFDLDTSDSDTNNKLSVGVGVNENELSATLDDSVSIPDSLDGEEQSVEKTPRNDADFSFEDSFRSDTNTDYEGLWVEDMEVPNGVENYVLFSENAHKLEDSIESIETVIRQNISDHTIHKSLSNDSDENMSEDSLCDSEEHMDSLESPHSVEPSGNENYMLVSETNYPHSEITSNIRGRVTPEYTILNPNYSKDKSVPYDITDCAKRQKLSDTDPNNANSSKSLSANPKKQCLPLQYNDSHSQSDSPSSSVDLPSYVDCVNTSGDSSSPSLSQQQSSLVSLTSPNHQPTSYQSGTDSSLPTTPIRVKYKVTPRKNKLPSSTSNHAPGDSFDSSASSPTLFLVDSQSLPENSQSRHMERVKGSAKPDGTKTDTKLDCIPSSLSNPDPRDSADSSVSSPGTGLLALDLKRPSNSQSRQTERANRPDDIKTETELQCEVLDLSTETSTPSDNENISNIFNQRQNSLLHKFATQGTDDSNEMQTQVLDISSEKSVSESEQESAALLSDHRNKEHIFDHPVSSRPVTSNPTDNNQVVSVSRNEAIKDCPEVVFVVKLKSNNNFSSDMVVLKQGIQDSVKSIDNNQSIGSLAVSDLMDDKTDEPINMVPFLTPGTVYTPFLDADGEVNHQQIRQEFINPEDGSTTDADMSCPDSLPKDGVTFMETGFQKSNKKSYVKLDVKTGRILKTSNDEIEEEAHSDGSRGKDRSNTGTEYSDDSLAADDDNDVTIRSTASTINESLNQVESLDSPPNHSLRIDNSGNHAISSFSRNDHPGSLPPSQFSGTIAPGEVFRKQDEISSQMSQDSIGETPQLNIGVKEPRNHSANSHSSTTNRRQRRRSQRPHKDFRSDDTDEFSDDSLASGPNSKPPSRPNSGKSGKRKRKPRNSEEHRKGDITSDEYAHSANSSFSDDSLIFSIDGRGMQEPTEATKLEISTINESINQMNTALNRLPNTGEKNKIADGTMTMSPVNVWSSGDSGIQPCTDISTCGMKKTTSDDVSIVSPKRQSWTLSISQPEIWMNTPSENSNLLTGSQESAVTNMAEIRSSSPSKVERLHQSSIEQDTDGKIKYLVTIDEDETKILYNVEKTEYRTFSVGDEANPSTSSVIPNTININLTETKTIQKKDNYEAREREKILYHRGNEDLDSSDAIVSSHFYQEGRSLHTEQDVIGDIVSRESSVDRQLVDSDDRSFIKPSSRVHVQQESVLQPIDVEHVLNNTLTEDDDPNSPESFLSTFVSSSVDVLHEADYFTEDIETIPQTESGRSVTSTGCSTAGIQQFASNSTDVDQLFSGPQDGFSSSQNIINEALYFQDEITFSEQQLNDVKQDDDQKKLTLQINHRDSVVHGSSVDNEPILASPSQRGSANRLSQIAFSPEPTRMNLISPRSLEEEFDDGYASINVNDGKLISLSYHPDIGQFEIPLDSKSNKSNSRKTSLEGQLSMLSRKSSLKNTDGSLSTTVPDEHPQTKQESESDNLCDDLASTTLPSNTNPKDSPTEDQMDSFSQSDNEHIINYTLYPSAAMVPQDALMSTTFNKQLAFDLSKKNTSASAESHNHLQNQSLISSKLFTIGDAYQQKDVSKKNVSPSAESCHHLQDASSISSKYTVSGVYQNKDEDMENESYLHEQPNQHTEGGIENESSHHLQSSVSLESSTLGAHRDLFKKNVTASVDRYNSPPDQSHQHTKEIRNKSFNHPQSSISAKSFGVVDAFEHKDLANRDISDVHAESHHHLLDQHQEGGIEEESCHNLQSSVSLESSTSDAHQSIDLLKKNVSASAERYDSVQDQFHPNNEEMENKSYHHQQSSISARLFTVAGAFEDKDLSNRDISDLPAESHHHHLDQHKEEEIENKSYHHPQSSKSARSYTMGDAFQHKDLLNRDISDVHAASHHLQDQLKISVDETFQHKEEEMKTEFSALDEADFSHIHGYGKKVKAVLISERGDIEGLKTETRRPSLVFDSRVDILTERRPTFDVYKKDYTSITVMAKPASLGIFLPESSLLKSSSDFVEPIRQHGNDLLINNEDLDDGLTPQQSLRIGGAFLNSDMTDSVGNNQTSNIICNKTMVSLEHPKNSSSIVYSDIESPQAALKIGQAFLGSTPVQSSVTRLSSRSDVDGTHKIIQFIHPMSKNSENTSFTHMHQISLTGGLNELHQRTLLGGTNTSFHLTESDQSEIEDSGFHTHTTTDSSLSPDSEEQKSPRRNNSIKSNSSSVSTHSVTIGIDQTDTSDENSRMSDNISMENEELRFDVQHVEFGNMQSDFYDEIDSVIDETVVVQSEILNSNNLRSVGIRTDNSMPSHFQQIADSSSEQTLISVDSSKIDTASNQSKSSEFYSSGDIYLTPENNSTSNSSIYKTPEQSPRQQQTSHIGPTYSDGLPVSSTRFSKTHQLDDSSETVDNLKWELARRIAKLQSRCKSLSDSAISSDFTDVERSGSFKQITNRISRRSSGCGSGYVSRKELDRSLQEINVYLDNVPPQNLIDHTIHRSMEYSDIPNQLANAMMESRSLMGSPPADNLANILDSRCPARLYGRKWRSLGDLSELSGTEMLRMLKADFDESLSRQSSSDEYFLPPNKVPDSTNDKSQRYISWGDIQCRSLDVTNIEQDLVVTAASRTNQFNILLDECKLSQTDSPNSFLSPDQLDFYLGNIHSSQEDQPMRNSIDQGVNCHEELFESIRRIRHKSPSMSDLEHGEPVVKDFEKAHSTGCVDILDSPVPSTSSSNDSITFVFVGNSEEKSDVTHSNPNVNKSSSSSPQTSSRRGQSEGHLAIISHQFENNHLTRRQLSGMNDNRSERSASCDNLSTQGNTELRRSYSTSLLDVVQIEEPEIEPFPPSGSADDLIDGEDERGADEEFLPVMFLKQNVSSDLRRTVTGQYGNSCLSKSQLQNDLSRGEPKEGFNEQELHYESSMDTKTVYNDNYYPRGILINRLTQTDDHNQLYNHHLDWQEYRHDHLDITSADLSDESGFITDANVYSPPTSFRDVSSNVNSTSTIQNFSGCTNSDLLTVNQTIIKQMIESEESSTSSSMTKVSSSTQTTDSEIERDILNKSTTETQTSPAISPIASPVTSRRTTVVQTDQDNRNQSFTDGPTNTTILAEIADLRKEHTKMMALLERSKQKQSRPSHLDLLIKQKSITSDSSESVSPVTVIDKLAFKQESPRSRRSGEDTLDSLYSTTTTTTTTMNNRDVNDDNEDLRLTIDLDSSDSSFTNQSSTSSQLNRLFSSRFNRDHKDSLVYVPIGDDNKRYFVSTAVSPDQPTSQESHNKSESLQDQLDKLQLERIEIIDLLNLNYLPASLTVELLEAKLNHCIGQTDALLQSLDETWDDDLLAIPQPPAQNITEISKEYINKYHTELKKSKRYYDVFKEEMERKFSKGRGRRRSRTTDLIQLKRKSQLEAFKLERQLEQERYEKTKLSTSRQTSPASPATSSSSFEPGYLTPRQRIDHLVGLRRNIVESSEEELNELRRRSVSPRFSDRSFSPDYYSLYSPSPSPRSMSLGNNPYGDIVDTFPSLYSPDVSFTGSTSASPNRGFQTGSTNRLTSTVRTPTSSNTQSTDHLAYISLPYQDYMANQLDPSKLLQESAAVRSRNLQEISRAHLFLHQSRHIADVPFRTSSPVVRHPAEVREYSPQSPNHGITKMDIDKDIEQLRTIQKSTNYRDPSFVRCASPIGSDVSSASSYAAYAKDILARSERSVHSPRSRLNSTFSGTTRTFSPRPSTPSSIYSADLESLTDSTSSSVLNTRPVNARDIKARIARRKITERRSKKPSDKR